jgi:acyl-CoA thioester hydrolase
MDGYAFSTEVRVRFAETDAQGVAHNAAYLVWYEVARVDYLARFAGGYNRIRNLGIEALTTETHVRYLGAVHFDDRLRINIRCGDLRGARFRFDYLIERVADDGAETVADGWTLHATVNHETLRPTRLPEWLREAIEAAEAA